MHESLGTHVILADDQLGSGAYGSYSNFMRQQAMSSRMMFNRPIPVNRLVSSIADSTYI